MSNYNNEILEFIPKYAERIVNELNRTNEIKIENLKYSVDGTEDTSISNYLSYESDSYFIFKFSYSYGTDKRYFDIIIPKEVAGVFVVKGKVVIPYNELVTDFTMKVHKGVLKLDNHRYIRQTSEGYILTVNNQLNYNLSDPESYAQIPTEYLELDEDQMKIIKSRTFIAKNLIDATIVKYLFDYDKRQNKVSDITDLTIRSTSSYVKNRLNSDFYSFMNSIRYKFRGGNRSIIGQIYTNEINKTIYKYFSINSGNFNYFNNVTNPITLQSLSSQVKVPYDKSFGASAFDMIDVIDTPINNNINKINYLNRNVKLEDGRIKIQVYDKDGNKIFIDKMDYISSNILESECWDYDNWKIKDSYVGKDLLVKYGKYELTVDSLDDIEYIELPANQRTSVTSSIMPMVNKSELARMAMGTSMVKQGVNLINAEDPIVTTEDLSELIKLNPLIITADADGTVTSVTRSTVVVNNDTIYKIPYSLQSYTGNLVPFIPVVNIGDKVEKGDILISPSNVSKNSVKYGVNAVVAFNAYFGYNSDDSMVISESFAKKLSSVYTHKQVISVRNAKSIKFIKKAGNYVNSNDVLFSYTVNHKKGKYSDLLDDNVTEQILTKAAKNNLIDAFIYEVNIKLGSGVNLDEESYEILDDLNRDIDLGDYEDKIPLLKESDLRVDDNEIKIEFSFIMTRKAKEGDKITNRYGNKGIISKIIPDDKMIRTEDGIIADVCLSRESVPARKNISQIYELYLGQISMQIKKLYNQSPEDKVRAVGVYNTLFKTHYSTDDFDARVSKYGDSAFNAMVGTYSELNVDEVFKALDDLQLDIRKTAYIGNRKLKSKVLFGPMYIIKLQFLPENTLAITTSKKLLGGAEPELGLGKYRGEGQKLGEMESTALSVNSPELLEYYKGLGGVNTAIKQLYFDLLSLGIDATSLATEITREKLEVSKDQLQRLKDKFNN